MTVEVGDRGVISPEELAAEGRSEESLRPESLD